MKNSKCITLLITILMAFTTGASTGQQIKEPPLAISIVFDAASSNRPNWQDIHSLARQTIFSLKTGDYFELISADQWNNHIRASQFIKTGSIVELDALVSRVQKISLPLIADTKLMEAVELAIYRMSKFVSKSPHIKPIIIVLTDGCVSSDEAALARKLAEKARNEGWKLFFTGTSNTNRKILIDSSNDILKWCLLKDATPSLWIQLQRLTACDKLLDPKIKKDVQQASNASLSQNKFQQKAGIKLITPELNESSSTYEVKNEVVSKVSISATKKKSILNGPNIKTDSSDKNKIPSAIIKQAEKNSSSKPVTTTNKADTTKKNLLMPHLNKYKSVGYRYLWWLIPVMIILLLISGLWLFSAKHAKQWRERISKHLKVVNAKHQGTIIAKLSGRVYSLGKFEHFPTVHIGSNLNNTIRIYDKNIADRHLMITRKADNLWLKNLSKTSLSTNGIPVKPSDWHILILPAIVTLNENVSIKFELRKPLITANKENSDGTEKTIEAARRSGNA